MTDIVRVGESIEGLSVDGFSRDPLMDRGLNSYKNKTYSRYIASFNVESKIVLVMPQGTAKIEEDAYCSLDAELTCDKAIIHSLSDRYTSNVSSNISATHGANLWHFPKQTNVKITRAHQDLINAMRKRQIKQQRKKIKLSSLKI